MAKTASVSSFGQPCGDITETAKQYMTAKYEILRRTPSGGNTKYSAGRQVAETRDKRQRVTITILLALGGVFLALVARCFQLQYYHNSYYQRLALRQQQAHVPQKPRRGAILDRSGRVLAASNEIKTLFAEPRTIKDPKQTACRLAKLLEMPAHEICRTITDSKNPGYVKIIAGLTAAGCDAVSKAKIKGIGIESEYRRYYPTGRLACHVVGFTSTDNHGLAGVEFKYDKRLSGSAARTIFLADTFRRPIRLKEQDGICTEGASLILTLDTTIQQITRSELLEQYRRYEAESAMAIVMEPATGAILAMVSLPDFDPEHSGKTCPDVLRNRALTDPYEPGSILKPIVAAIAIEAGVLSVNEKIFCEYGKYSGKGFGRITEYGNHQFGNLTVREILVKSSNIGMAKIGQRLGKDRLYQGLKLFGFGRKTGIDLPGEDSGLVWPADKWTGYSVTRIPFGQEISATAIQIVRAFCVLANGGRHIRPYVVEAMVDNQGNIIKLGPVFAKCTPNGNPVKSPPTPGFVIRPAVARWIVNKALVGVVNEGTGKRAALKKWQVFGKTGTANIARSDGTGFADNEYVASFVGAAPAERPAAVVFVAIRKPNKKLGLGYTGGTVAAPAVAKILAKTLTYLEQTGR